MSQQTQRPKNDDKEGWKAYWKAQGQPWRTEPEIDAERQKYLAERLAIKPNIQQGMYPFKDVKLTRADIEWLLATHENGRGPVDWSDESQRGREGLDVRAADLRHLDLRNLPLARLIGGLTWEEHLDANEEQWIAAGVLMEGATLRKAQLQGAILGEARLQGAILSHAHLQLAAMRRAQLQGTDLRHAQLEGAYLSDVLLADEKHIGPHLADAHWGNANLAVVDWSSVSILWDEYVARQKKHDGKGKEKATRLNEYRVAVRANRQLAVALQEQGLNEEAVRFTYRAQKLQRMVFRLQRKFGQYLFSGFLDILAGYGYRPGRTVIWYLVIIFGFALAYDTFGHITPLEAFVLSLTSFHGRGFFPGTNLTLSDPRVVLAAFEAVVGLIIEISFIATFTQRFFGK